MNDEKRIILTSGVEVETAYVGKVGSGIDVYRIILKIWSTLPKETAGLIKEYEVWVSEEYLEDHHKHEASELGAKKFAIDVLKGRFIASGNTVPRENGLKATNEHGIELGNPQYISESVARVNVVVSKSQAKWLKEQAHNRGSNVSAIIRDMIAKSQNS